MANLKKKQKGIQNEISKKKRSAQQLNAQIDRLIEIEIEKARKRAEEEARRKAAAEAAAQKAAAAKVAEANKRVVKEPPLLQNRVPKLPKERLHRWRNLI